MLLYNKPTSSLSQTWVNCLWSVVGAKSWMNRCLLILHQAKADIDDQGSTTKDG